MKDILSNFFRILDIRKTLTVRFLYANYKGNRLTAVNKIRNQKRVEPVALPEALKDRKKQLWLLIFIVLVIMNLIFLFSYKPVQVRDIKRRCVKGTCNISFRLHNRTPRPMSTYVMIRAYKRLSGSRSNELRRKKVGEAAHYYELGPREKRDLTIEMYITAPKPDMVSVKAMQKPG